MEVEKIQQQLREPFEVIHYRPKTFRNGKVLMLAYLDSRDVQDRLDSVFGVDGWSDEYQEISGNLYCSISAMGVTKTDCGVESNTDAEKGQASDAFKRSAVKWGIGRYLYKMKPLWLPILERGEQYVAIKDNSGTWHKGYINLPKQSGVNKEELIKRFTSLYADYLKLEVEVPLEIDRKFKSWNDNLRYAKTEDIIEHGKAIKKFIEDSKNV